MWKENLIAGCFLGNIPKDKIVQLILKGTKKKEIKDEIKMEIEKSKGIVGILAGTPYPMKNLKDLLREDELFRKEYYTCIAHESAHYLLMNTLNEEEYQKFKEIEKEMKRYETIWISNKSVEVSEYLYHFYSKKFHLFSTFPEIYAHAISTLVIIELIEKGKILMREAKRYFENLLYSLLKWEVYL